MSFSCYLAIFSPVYFQKVSDALSLRLGKEAKTFDAKKIHDKSLKRKLNMLSDIGSSALPKDKLTR